MVAPLRGRGLKHGRDGHHEGPAGRSLTGAWIETRIHQLTLPYLDVAPLRGRGLKHGKDCLRTVRIAVAPLRGRGLKPKKRNQDSSAVGRSLTGAWIET